MRRRLCPLKTLTQASLPTPTLVPVNNDLPPARAMQQSKSSLHALISGRFGTCLSVPLFTFAFCAFSFVKVEISKLG